MTKKWMVGAVVLAMAGGAWAEAERTLLTRENKMPEKGQLEANALFGIQKLEHSKNYQETPQLRFGLLDNLAVNAAVPFKQMKPDTGFGRSEAGLGDVSLGFELVPYERVFRFPYILPHVDVGLPTGDDKKGLGSGDVSIAAGVTVGTTTYEVYHWALDVGFQHLVDNDPLTDDDALVVSASFLWDVSDEFALLTEMRGTDQELPDGRPLTFEGGMVYKPEDTSWMFGLYGGKTIHAGETWNGSLKISYSF